MSKILKLFLCCMLMISCSNDEENIINGNSDYKFPFEVVITGESNSVSTIPFNVAIHPILTGDVANPNPNYQYKFAATDAVVKNGDVLLTEGNWLNYEDLTDGILTLMFSSANSNNPKSITVT